ncbi:MAG: EAL domain-containing protein [Oscillospiraceae bacterium]|nr:EAL domain-containing protein [Oscillospiraceae bacterium]MCI2036289.1 EAL domain-containing protein [Oscillospiraceae bacterium]
MTEKPKDRVPGPGTAPATGGIATENTACGNREGTAGCSAGGKDGGPILPPNGREDARRRDQLENLLSHALKNDRFLIYYQPLYTVSDGKFTEAEALLRLKDADGKFVPPDEFIPVAERSGLIVDIGGMVLDKVCRYIRELLSCRVDIDSISVNLSVVQLMQDDVVERLLGIIRRNGISPNRIVLEVTESTLISNYAVVGEKIRRLSAAGIQFALDDFGTGYSNITNVIDLPFDGIKLDKSLIWDSVVNERCSVMIRDLTRTFKNISLGVTAEGVETQAHDRFARLCGCDKIQGYRYAKPLPVSQAGDFFGRRAI